MSAVRLLDGVISDINAIPERSKKKISSQLLIIFIFKFL